MRDTYSFSLCMVMLLPCIAYGQAFQNGDLDGVVTGWSSLPDQWQAVPDYDPVCQATAWNAATPDLTSEFAPDTVVGAAGTSYSGLTYMSGSYGDDGSFFWQEGIQQEVSGFTPGMVYDIGFQQCLDARGGVEDTSGSWAVYVDTTLVGITAASISHVVYNDLDLEWEQRHVMFTATAGIHTIKFLPLDDDTSYNPIWGDLSGALNMGIDMIELGKGDVSINENTFAVNARYDPQQCALLIDGVLFTNARYVLFDLAGRAVRSGVLRDHRISTAGLPQSSYVLRFPELNAVQRFLRN
ncbi:MAG: hypothetical protein ABI599_05690 [Flavobacteriales bacterium]